jgi:hypothetical protein
VIARGLQGGMLDLAESQSHPTTCFCCHTLYQCGELEKREHVYLGLLDRMCKFVGYALSMLEQTKP